MRRVRARRSTQVIVAAMAIVVVAAGVVFAARSVGDPPPEPPANNEATPVPEGRLLYLLDPNNLGGSSQVVAIDPETEKRVDVFPAGYDPQMALSPAGDRLYVVSTRQPEGIDSLKSVVDTFDTSTGRRLTRASLPSVDGTTRDRTLHKLPPYTSDFVTSADGSRIYFGLDTVRRGPSNLRLPLIATFDTQANELLPNTVVLVGCSKRILLPGVEADTLTVVCTGDFSPSGRPTSTAFFVRVGDDGSSPEQAHLERIDLPDVGGGFGEAAGAVSTADGETIYAVTRGGHIYVIDVATHTVSAETDLEPAVRVQFGKVAVSADGSTLYVGTTPLGSSSVVDANGIGAYDTSTWQQLATVRAGDYFWSMALGPGGSRLYAPTFDEPRWSIQVFDARTLEQLATIGNVGRTPSLIEVPRLGR